MNAARHTRVMSRLWTSHVTPDTAYVSRHAFIHMIHTFIHMIQYDSYIICMIQPDTAYVSRHVTAYVSHMR